MFLTTYLPTCSF